MLARIGNILRASAALCGLPPKPFSAFSAEKLVGQVHEAARALLFLNELLQALRPKFSAGE